MTRRFEMHARRVESRTRCGHPLRQPGAVIGTLLYLSPEQVRGDEIIDSRSDLFSLGVMLFEMVTGYPPFTGESTLDLLAAMGSWQYQGTLYQDLLLRFIVDVPALTPADDFFRRYKETLKARFEQIDIWISSHEIQIL